MGQNNPEYGHILRSAYQRKHAIISKNIFWTFNASQANPLWEFQTL